jgi:hypothetical protein
LIEYSSGRCKVSSRRGAGASDSLPKLSTQKSQLAIRFPIFRKYFQKHGKQHARAQRGISTKGLPNYDLSIQADRGIGIAYVKGAHP